MNSDKWANHRRDWGSRLCIWYCRTHLSEQLRQACMQMLILQFVSTEDGLDLGGSGGLAAKSHHPQRRGHHYRGDEDVLRVFLLRHVVVEAKSKSHKKDYLLVLRFCKTNHHYTQLWSQKCVDIRPEGQIGAGVSQRGGVAAQLLVLCRGHEAQQTKSDNVSHPHPVCLLKQPWQPVKRAQRKKLGLNATQPAVAS